MTTINTLDPPVAASSSLTFELLRGRSGLEFAADQWNELTARIAEPRFCQFADWYRCIADLLDDQPDEMLTVVAYDGDEAVAVVPLRLRKRRLLGIKIRRLELPHHPHIPFSDFIVADDGLGDRLLPQLVEHLNRHSTVKWDQLSFLRLLGQPPWCDALPRSHFIKTVDAAGHCDYLPVLPHEEMQKWFTSRHRNNLRRARKSADAAGEVTFRCAETPDELETAFADFLEIEASGWKGREGTGTAIKLDPTLVKFYRSLLDRFGRQGACRIYSLQLDGRTIASQFFLCSDHEVCELKIGYDESASKFAPGNLLVSYILEDCALRPDVRHFNFASDAAWHGRWKPLRHEVVDVGIYKRSLRGRLAWAHDRLRRAAWRFAMNRLRPIYRKLRGRDRSTTRKESNS